MLYILDSHKGLIGTCEGFSYAIQRERTPVYVMGNAAPELFTPSLQAITVSLSDAHGLAVPANASLIVVGTCGPEATKHIFMVEGAYSIGGSASSVSMSVYSIDFGSCGHERLGRRGTGDYDLAMALVNYELRKREMSMDNWFEMLEAQHGGE